MLTWSERVRSCKKPDSNRVVVYQMRRGLSLLASDSDLPSLPTAGRQARNIHHGVH